MATTNTSSSSSTTTEAISTTTMMNELLPRHGPIEMCCCCCCENDTTAFRDAAATAGKGQGEYSSFSHFNSTCCQQDQHKDRRRNFTMSWCYKQKRLRRHRFVPFSSSPLLILSPIVLLLIMTAALDGFFVHAQSKYGCGELFDDCLVDADCCDGLVCPGVECIVDEGTCGELLDICVVDDDCCDDLVCPAGVECIVDEGTCGELFDSCIVDADCCFGLVCPGIECILDEGTWMITNDYKENTGEVVVTAFPTNFTFTEMPTIVVPAAPSPTPRPATAFFPIFWAFEPTPQPVEDVGDNDPTEFPSPSPTMTPDTPPGNKVTSAPSTDGQAPTPRPTLVTEESAQPSEPPVAVITKTNSPTSRSPTLPPTFAPTTPWPTKTPTTSRPTTVTAYPTFSPKPTLRPSQKPITASPSMAPIGVPKPTATPSLRPTLPFQSHDVDTAIIMTSMASKITNGIDWESATEAHIKNSIEINTKNIDPALMDLDVETDIKGQVFVASPATQEPQQNTGLRQRRHYRQLQSSEDPQPLLVQFVVRVRFRSEQTLSSENVSDLVGDAFNSDEERAAYIDRLQQTSNNGFPYLTTVAIEVEGDTPIEEGSGDEITGNENDDDANDSTLWIIIGAAGGGFLAIVLLGFLACRRIGAQQQQKKNDNGGIGVGMIGVDDIYNGRATSNQTASNSTPSMRLGVHTEILVDRQDDISTLGDPVFGNGMMADHDGAERDEQTASVGNDYDYSKQYLRAQGISGSLITDSTSRDRLLSADSGRSSFTSNGQHKLGQPVAPSDFSDDASFDQQFDNVIATEQQFDVIVPPGKLGMVVDTPNGGCPVVHAIKTESILANRVQVGDRLVAVDSEDVTAMTAVQVSKLISLRSDQDRKLVFVRFISPEAMMHIRSRSNQSNGGRHGSGLLRDDNDEEKETNLLG